MLLDKGIIKKMATDAMFKLEHGSDDVKKGQRSAATMSILEQKRDEWRDDYLLNKLARQKFRVWIRDDYLLNKLARQKLRVWIRDDYLLNKLARQKFGVWIRGIPYIF